MSYLALYRKYRPRNFSEVVGRDAIVKTLTNQILKNQISHAYLFTGSRGTGKTSIAKIFARAINCENFTEKGLCEKCQPCKTLESPTNMDILEIDAASNNRVDEIRELRENVKFTPVVGKYKVFIIDEVHMLTDSAFNALLKTLEEPPEHVVFILATTEAHKLPATILSRCMRFDFPLIPLDVLMSHLMNILTKEKINYEPEAVKTICVAAEGSVRDCLSIAESVIAFAGNNITQKDTDKVLGTPDKKTILNFCDALIKKDIGEGLEIIDNVTKNGKNMSVFVKDISCHIRDLLVIKTCKSPNEILSLPKDLFEEYQLQATKSQSKDLIENLRIFSSIEAELKYALSPRTLVETALVTAISGDEGLKKN